MNTGGRPPVTDLAGLHPVHPRVATGVVGHQPLAACIAEGLGHIQYQLVAHVPGCLQRRGFTSVLGETEEVDMAFARALNVQLPGIGVTIVMFERVNKAVVMVVCTRPWHRSYLLKGGAASIL